MSDPYVFAGSPLDRAAVQRRDRRWLEARLEDDASRFLPMWKLQPLVKTGSAPGLAWARTGIRGSADREVGEVLLGLDGDVAHFAVDLSVLEKPQEELGLDADVQFLDARMIASQLAPGEAAIVAHARSMVDWHARHRFCAECGEPTTSGDAGYQRSCRSSRCDAEHFPRTDPVAIMLAIHDGRCLLGRQKAWPANMYSALAGFVEPGETLEECVRREVFEEAGVPVGAVCYHSSQPWPFPSSLMLGCIAEAEADAITVDEHEIEEARWFTLDEVRAALASDDGTPALRVPPPMAIAHQLLRAWAQEGDA